MTNVQLYVALGIPAFMSLFTIGVVIVGILLNRQDATTIRTEMRADRAELINKIEKVSERVHDDMTNIMGRDREMDKRVMKLEGAK